jgi:hypothetical protein
MRECDAFENCFFGFRKSKFLYLLVLLIKDFLEPNLLRELEFERFRIIFSLHLIPSETISEFTV